MNVLNISEFFKDVSNISNENIKIQDNVISYEKYNILEKMNFLEDIPKYIFKDLDDLKSKKKQILEYLKKLFLDYENSINFNLKLSLNKIVYLELFKNLNLEDNKNYLAIKNLFINYNNEKWIKKEKVKKLNKIKNKIIDNKNMIKEEINIYNKSLFDINFKYKLIYKVF